MYALNIFTVIPICKFDFPLTTTEPPQTLCESERRKSHVEEAMDLGFNGDVGRKHLVPERFGRRISYKTH
jgi:hypothetical protein